MTVTGLVGLFKGRTLAPDLSGQTRGALKVVRGDSARRWGSLSASAGMLFLIIPLVGLMLVSDFLHSAAYIHHLLPPPDGYNVLYSLRDGQDTEVAYGFQQDLIVIHQAYAEQLRLNGFSISDQSPILLVANKGVLQLTLNFIGWQQGDNKPYRTKVILTYRGGPDAW